jgi:hypothetical protein
MTNVDLTALTSYINSEIAEIEARAKAEGWTFWTKPMDAQSWYDMYGYTTVEEYEEHRDMAEFSDWYKEENGIRPRGFTVKEARAWMAREWEYGKVTKAEEEARAKTEEKREAEVMAEVSTKPVNSAMADAFKRG